MPQGAFVLAAMLPVPLLLNLFPACTGSAYGRLTSPAADPKQCPTMGDMTLRHLPLVARGKVRDLYRLDDRLLMVASDRISAFDVVMPTAIPDKGRVLTRLSLFWFDKLAHIVPNHVLSADLDGLGLGDDERAWLEGRAMIVRRADVLPVECVARGYLIGSGWKDYRTTGRVSGLRLPEGLRLADRLPEPIFTPSTKAATGNHDAAISFADVVDRLGRECAERLRSLTLEIFRTAASHAATCGLILADTKFEFGIIDGEIVLVDECLTSDSSRYWLADAWKPGISPPALDKQILRDWLESRSGWNKTAPGPEIPELIVARTRESYIEAFERLAGCRFA